MGPRSHHFWARLQRKVSETSPNSVYLEMGTNDLDAGYNPTTVAQELFDRATSLIQRRQVSKITIGQVIPRSEHRFPGSRDATIQFNLHLQALIAGSNEISFWKHRGLWTPTSLAADGVHPDRHRGMNKYAQSIHHAINHMLYR